MFPEPDRVGGRSIYQKLETDCKDRKRHVERAVGKCLAFSGGM